MTWEIMALHGYNLSQPKAEGISFEMRPCSQCVRMRNRLPSHPIHFYHTTRNSIQLVRWTRASLHLPGGYAQTGSCMYKWPCPPYLSKGTSRLLRWSWYWSPEVFDLIFRKGGTRYKNGVESITYHKLILELRGDDNTHHWEVMGQKQENEDTHQWRPWTNGRKLGYSKLGTLYHLKILFTARISEQKTATESLATFSSQQRR